MNPDQSPRLSPAIAAVGSQTLQTTANSTSVGEIIGPASHDTTAPNPHGGETHNDQRANVIGSNTLASNGGNEMFVRKMAPSDPRDQQIELLMRDNARLLRKLAKAERKLKKSRELIQDMRDIVEKAHKQRGSRREAIPQLEGQLSKRASKKLLIPDAVHRSKADAGSVLSMQSASGVEAGVLSHRQVSQLPTPPRPKSEEASEYESAKEEQTSEEIATEFSSRLRSMEDQGPSSKSNTHDSDDAATGLVRNAALTAQMDFVETEATTAGFSSGEPSEPDDDLRRIRHEPQHQAQTESPPTNEEREVPEREDVTSDNYHVMDDNSTHSSSDDESDDDEKDGSVASPASGMLSSCIKSLDDEIVLLAMTQIEQTNTYTYSRYRPPTPVKPTLEAVGDPKLFVVPEKAERAPEEDDSRDDRAARNSPSTGPTEVTSVSNSNHSCLTPPLHRDEHFQTEGDAKAALPRTPTRDHDRDSDSFSHRLPCSSPNTHDFQPTPDTSCDDLGLSRQQDLSNSKPVFRDGQDDNGQPLFPEMEEGASSTITSTQPNILVMTASAIAMDLSRHSCSDLMEHLQESSEQRHFEEHRRYHAAIDLMSVRPPVVELDPPPAHWSTDLVFGESMERKDSNDESNGAIIMDLSEHDKLLTKDFVTKPPVRQITWKGKHPPPSLSQPVAASTKAAAAQNKDDDDDTKCGDDDDDDENDVRSQSQTQQAARLLSEARPTAALVVPVELRRDHREALDVRQSTRYQTSMFSRARSVPSALGQNDNTMVPTAKRNVLFRTSSLYALDDLSDRGRDADGVLQSSGRVYRLQRELYFVPDGSVGGSSRARRLADAVTNERVDEVESQQQQPSLKKAEQQQMTIVDTSTKKELQQLPQTDRRQQTTVTTNKGPPRNQRQQSQQNEEQRKPPPRRELVHKSSSRTDLGSIRKRWFSSSQRFNSSLDDGEHSRKSGAQEKGVTETRRAVKMAREQSSASTKERKVAGNSKGGVYQGFSAHLIDYQRLYQPVRASALGDSMSEAVIELAEAAKVRRGLPSSTLGVRGSNTMGRQNSGSTFASSATSSEETADLAGSNSTPRLGIAPSRSAAWRS